MLRSRGREIPGRLESSPCTFHVVSNQKRSETRLVQHGSLISDILSMVTTAHVAVGWGCCLSPAWVSNCSSVSTIVECYGCGKIGTHLRQPAQATRFSNRPFPFNIRSSLFPSHTQSLLQPSPPKAFFRTFSPGQEQSVAYPMLPILEILSFKLCSLIIK